MIDNNLIDARIFPVIPDQRLRQVGLAGPGNRFGKDLDIDRAVEVDIKGFDLDRCFDKRIARHTLGASPTPGRGRGLVEQRYGVLLIARLAAAHEHDGIVMLGVGQPGRAPRWAFNARASSTCRSAPAQRPLVAARRPRRRRRSERKGEGMGSAATSQNCRGMP